MVAAAQTFLSETLVKYAQYLYNTQQSRGRFSTCLLALSDKGVSKEVLKLAWRANKRWKSLEPSTPHVPMPRCVLLALFSLFAGYGEVEFACLILLGFSCLLRPGEMLGLRRQNLVFPEDSGGRHELIYVCLPSHKTHVQVGQQHVILRDLAIVRYLRTVFGSKHPDRLLFEGGDGRFLRLWAKGCAFFQLGSRYTLACLRSGGATDMMDRGMPVDPIQYRLRHSDARTCRHYIQEAGCALALGSLPAAVRNLVDKFEEFALPFLLRHGSTRVSRTTALHDSDRWIGLPARHAVQEIPPSPLQLPGAERRPVGSAATGAP